MPERDVPGERTLVRTSSATVFDDGGCPALRNGDRVRVDGVRQPDGSVLASEVEVDEIPVDPRDDDGDDDDRDDDDGEVHPEGVLTGLGGACPNVTFRVSATLVRHSDRDRVRRRRLPGAAKWRPGGGSTGCDSPTGRCWPPRSRSTSPTISTTPMMTDSLNALDVEIDPDEWRLDWAQGSQSGSGGANLRVRLEGAGAGEIVGSSVTLSGPGGAIGPVSFDSDDDDLEAEFAKSQAIGLIGGTPAGGLVAITVGVGSGTERRSPSHGRWRSGT